MKEMYVEKRSRKKGNFPEKLMLVVVYPSEVEWPSMRERVEMMPMFPNKFIT